MTEQVTEQVVPFTKNDIEKYLDRCIGFWRNKLKNENDDHAKYYIDAFQSVRLSILGEVKKTNE